MSVLHIDFETCSRLDLRKVGADVYSRDPDLIVTVVAWAFDGGPVQSTTNVQKLPTFVLAHLFNGGEFRAWNAGFEWAILTNHFKLTLDPAQAVCVQQKALHSGLPASLEDAGPAIGAPQHKDATARRLMLQLSKPRRNRGGPDSFWHMDEPSKLDALEAYCRQDVEAERAIDGMIADLPPGERAISILDRQANNRGVKLDLKFVSALKALALDETAKLNLECSGLTQGAVTSPGTQTARLLAWLNRQPEVQVLSQPEVQILLTDVGKESVADALAKYDKGEWAGPITRRVLEIRQEIAKSSLKKMDAMLRCAGPEDRVRGQLAYYGAFRNGALRRALDPAAEFPAGDHQGREQLHPIHASHEDAGRGLRALRLGTAAGRHCDGAARLSGPCFRQGFRGPGPVADRSAGDRVAGWPWDDLLYGVRGWRRMSTVYMQHKARSAVQSQASERPRRSVWDSAWGSGASSITPLTYGVVVSVAGERERWCRTGGAREQLHHKPSLVSARRRGGGSCCAPSTAQPRSPAARNQ